MHAEALLLASAYLFRTVAGWGFLPPSTVAEGATATFKITNTDGGGYSFPYTMTVFKQAANLSDEQVGLVYTNDTVYYWECNQSAGANVKFRLTSKANVNDATSDWILVQPGAQATASSLSVLSVASTSSKRFQTDNVQPSTTVTGGGTAVVTEQASSKNVPMGVIVGASIGGALLLVGLILIALLIRWNQRPNGHQEMVQHESVMPFLYGDPQQHVTPPVGYVTYSNTDEFEEPPQYLPPEIESAGYFARSGPSSTAGMSETSNRPALRSGKSRYLPMSTRPY